METVSKYAGYAAGLAVAFVVALALLVSPLASEKSEAGAATIGLASASVSATGIQTVTVTDAVDIGASTDFIIGQISGTSSGSAKFTSGGGQSLVCFNGAACDTDGAVNTTIIVKITGTGTSGAIIFTIALNDGVDGLIAAGIDGSVSNNLAYTQTSPAATVVLVASSSGIPVTAIPATATTGTVLTAIVTSSAGTAVTPGTTVTFQAVGVGVFQDTITAAEVVAALAGGGAYDAAAATNSGCSAGEGLQSCTSATETADDGEVIATAEPVGSGQASVHFEGAGVAGSTVITARVGAAGPSATKTINVFGTVSSIELARTGTGATLGVVEFVRNLTTSTANVVVTVTDAGGVPIVGNVPTFVVTSPLATAGPVTLAGAANGTIPSCAAGTGAAGTCNILVTSSTTQGVNTIFVGNGPAATATVSATIDVTVVGAAATVEIVDPPTSVAPLSSTTLTISVLDAEGDAAPDGTAVTVLATGTGVIVGPVGGVVTAGGTVSVTLVAGNTDGLVEVLAIVGALPSAQATIQVSSTPSGGAPEGAFDLELPTVGFGLNTFGSNVQGLAAAMAAGGCTQVWFTSAGSFIVYIPTTNVAAVNAAFNALWTDGVIDAGTPFLLGTCTG